MVRVALLLVLAFALCSVEARRKPGRRRPQHESRELDNELDLLKTQVQELEARLNDLESIGSAGAGDAAAHAGAGCHSEKVHLHFHGAGEEVDHGSPEDTYVHVKLGLDYDDFRKHHGYHHDDDDVHEYIGHCEVQPIGSASVHGYIQFYQWSNESTAVAFVDLGDLPEANQAYGMHVHETGDISDGHRSLKGHYDPHDPDSDVGDIGPATSDSGKAAINDIEHTHLSLIGPYSILGRSVILHNTDGSPMAYCIIGVGQESVIYAHHDDHSHDHDDDHDDDHDHHGHVHGHGRRRYRGKMQE